jgi:hypothetical protein
MNGVSDGVFSFFRSLNANPGKEQMTISIMKGAKFREDDQ